MTSQDNISAEEAELLLYLFDELDPARRGAFESRLAQDAALRQRLADLQGVDKRMSFASRPPSPPMSERALQSSLRVVREQILLQNSTVAVAPRFRIPPYAIAAGIAVAFTLGFISWLYTTSPQPSPVAPMANNRAGQNFGFPGNAVGGYGLSNGFVPSMPDIYADSSREIDQEIDALSMLADFQDGSDSN